MDPDPKLLLMMDPDLKFLLLMDPDPLNMKADPQPRDEAGLSEPVLSGNLSFESRIRIQSCY